MLSYSINPRIHDKPPIWQPSFASGWQRVDGDLASLRDAVLAGHAFIPAALTSEHRSSAAFAHADLAVVDIDNGLTLDDFLAHPLAPHAAFVYTTASHDPEHGKHRFRIVFCLPHRVDDPDRYKAIVTLLSRSLGGDKSCTDPARLFYGCSYGANLHFQPKALLPDSILDDAEKEILRNRLDLDRVGHEYDDDSIAIATFVLEEVIEPTADGERDRFIKITSAASSGGDALFPAWSDWASRGHHGKGKNSKQTSEKFFRGFNGRVTLATLFHIANNDYPGWRDRLPEELRKPRPFLIHSPNVAGYSHEDFLGFDDDHHSSRVATDTKTPSIFDADKPWTKIAAPLPDTPPPPPSENTDDSSPDPDLGDDDEPLPPDIDPACLAAMEAEAALDDPDDDAYDLDGILPFDEDSGLFEEEPAQLRRGRPRKEADEKLIEEIRDNLKAIYPGLRLNMMSQQLEYGPLDNPIEIPDVSTAYVRISMHAGKVFGKTITYDTAQVIGFKYRYHPVQAYLEKCASTVTPCPYFKTLATELLGLSDDSIRNPRFADGRTYADVILERFLKGAVARVLKPGCDHDWMPILIGPQNCGKSNFFRFLTPTSPLDPGDYPWISTIQQGIRQLKEKPHILHASWFVMLDEIERYFRREFVEEMKNLISVSVDRSARKYENERNFPRSFVLCGCANSNDFFVDPTGNRRFLPILVQGIVPAKEDPKILTVDLDRIKLDRDAIWSAAYQAFQEDPNHTFSSYELSEMAEFLDGFRYDNPLDGKLLQILSMRISGVCEKFGKYVTFSDVNEWLEIPADRAAATRVMVSDSLRRLGYITDRARLTKGGRAQRIWYRPE